MNKELKLRLICFLVGTFIISTGYFLTGDWRNECRNEDCSVYSPGEPVFEFDVVFCRISISSNIVLLMIGMPIFMASICPIRLTSNEKYRHAREGVNNGKNE